MNRLGGTRPAAAAILTSLLLLSLAQVALADEEPYSGTEVKGTVVTTLADQSSPTVLAQSQENLPATGADVGPWLALGVGLLILGSLVVIAARSRRVGTRKG